MNERLALATRGAAAGGAAFRGVRSAARARRPRALAAPAIARLLVASVAFAAEQAPSGEELYRAACAACHGGDGSGGPASAVAFPEPLPDFTDCGFATREPDEDWAAVTHGGGPARGFARIMPAYGQALTRDQIDAILAHIRGFCRSAAWPRGELNLPRPLVTEKAYPEDEAVWTGTVDADGDAALDNELVYEKRIGARSQIEIAAPFGWEKRGGGEPGASAWTSGIGDVALGFKHALFHRLDRGSILSLGAEVKLPTGDDDAGFGAGTTIFEPFVLFGQMLGRSGFLHLQAAVEIPADEERAEDEAILRLALGRSFTPRPFGRSWTPMVELLGAKELAPDEDPQWDVAPQLQVTLSTRQHVMANVGARIPVSETEGRDTRWMVYLLWDWFDGGMFDGW